MGTLCPSTSSTRTRRLRKRASSTRRKASTTWSRRRSERALRCRSLTCSVVDKLLAWKEVWLRFLVRRAGFLQTLFVRYLTFEAFLCKRNAEAVGKTVSRVREFLCQLVSRWQHLSSLKRR